MQTLQIYGILGSNTEIGKTYTSVAILGELKKMGKTTLGVKIVETGVSRAGTPMLDAYGKQIRDSKKEIILSSGYGVDTTALYEASSLPQGIDDAKKLSIKDSNYKSYPLPAAPYVVASLSNKEVLSYLLGRILLALDARLDALLLESAGGIYSPMGKGYYMLDVFCELFYALLAAKEEGARGGILKLLSLDRGSEIAKKIEEIGAHKKEVQIDLALVCVVHGALGCINDALLCQCALGLRAKEIAASLARLGISTDKLGIHYYINAKDEADFKRLSKGYLDEIAFPYTDKVSMLIDEVEAS